MSVFCVREKDETRDHLFFACSYSYTMCRNVNRAVHIQMDNEFIGHYLLKPKLHQVQIVLNSFLNHFKWTVCGT